MSTRMPVHIPMRTSVFISIRMSVHKPMHMSIDLTMRTSKHMSIHMSTHRWRRHRRLPPSNEKLSRSRSRRSAKLLKMRFILCGHCANHPTHSPPVDTAHCAVCSTPVHSSLLWTAQTLVPWICRPLNSCTTCLFTFL